MPIVRRLALSLTMLGCGSSEKPAAPAADAVKIERPVADAPHHDAKMLGDEEGAMHTVATSGSMSVKIDGEPTVFSFLPFGSNVAAWSEKTGVARVAIAGAPTDEGRPMLRLVFENLRIDRAKLPLTLTLDGSAPAEAVGKDTVQPRIEYLLDDRKLWLGDGAGASATVTIEAFEDERLRGTFRAKLVPKSTAFGPPIELADGRFDVELRLQGVAPGAVTPAP